MTRPARHRFLKRRTSAQANATLAATALLTAARNRGIDVDVAAAAGGELILILVAPLKVPRNVRRWFEIWLLENFHDEVRDLVLQENAVRPEAAS